MEGERWDGGVCGSVAVLGKPNLGIAKVYDLLALVEGMELNLVQQGKAVAQYQQTALDRSKSRRASCVLAAAGLPG